MQNSGISSPANPSGNQSRGESTHKRFALTGRSSSIDRRIIPARSDLADVRLADRLFAPHYAKAMNRVAIVRDWLFAERSDEAPVSEILPGEGFQVLELAGDWAWGVSPVDHAVGYVRAASLGSSEAATHIVAVPRADVLAEASSDAEAIGTLPMGSRVTLSKRGWGAAPGGGFVARDTLVPLGGDAVDFADVAERMVGAPAIAAGRSGAGVNCTGLVFLACDVAGVDAPRFCDLQAAALGSPLVDGAPLQRGDILYFDDHAAILRDADTVIHADLDAGTVVTEPLGSLIADGRYGAIVARRRLG